MWQFLRREALFFLIGFVITFIIYLFVRFDADKIILGVVLGVLGGVAVAAFITLLERRFPEGPA